MVPGQVHERRRTALTEGEHRVRPRSRHLPPHLGVSKLARLVDMYARRLQLQERLTEQLSRVVMESIDAKGVGVMIEARHLCMMMRGVEKQNSTMVTSSVLGVFRDYVATREEFLTLIGRRDG